VALQDAKACERRTTGTANGCPQFESPEADSSFDSICDFCEVDFFIVYFRLDVTFVALLQLDILDTYAINRKIR
jgi:hypothetical protein